MPISDKEIIRRIKEEGLIENGVTSLIDDGVISYGPSSSGYDLRCGYHFKVFKAVTIPNERKCPANDIPRGIRGEVLDPKNPDSNLFEDVYLKEGEVLILYPGEYALTHSIEKINMPRDLVVTVLGKSTYARCQVIVNVTPFESEWSGHPTLEIANVGTISTAIYPGEGVAQLLFHEIDGEVLTSYADRKGKYQDQAPEQMLSKVK